MIKAVDRAAPVDDIRILKGGRTLRRMDQMTRWPNHHTPPRRRRHLRRPQWSDDRRMVLWIKGFESWCGLWSPTKADPVGGLLRIAVADGVCSDHLRRHRHLAHRRDRPRPNRCWTSNSPDWPGDPPGCPRCRRPFCPAGWPVSGRTLIVNLPGSPRRRLTAWTCSPASLHHALDQLGGGVPDDGGPARCAESESRSPVEHERLVTLTRPAGAVVGFAGVVRDHDGRPVGHPSAEQTLAEQYSAEISGPGGRCRRKSPPATGWAPYLIDAAPGLPPGLRRPPGARRSETFAPGW